MEVTVSICCQTYNQVNYIEKAIESFLMQKVDFVYEILLRDDASTDGTAEICKNYSERFPDKIRLLSYKENQWNQGVKPFKDNVKRAQGKYIAICEGDDYWTDPLKLQKQVDFLEANKDYGLVYTEVDFYHENSQQFQRNVFRSGVVNSYTDTVSYLVNTGYRAPCSWLIRTNLLNEISYPKKFVDGTFVIMLEIMLKSKVKFLEDSTAVYRVIKESASHSSSLVKRFAFGEGLLKIQKYFIKKYCFSAEVVSRVGHRMYPILIPGALVLRKQQLLDEAFEFLKKNRSGLFEHLLFYMLSFPFFSRNMLKLIYKLKGRL